MPVVGTNGDEILVLQLEFGRNLANLPVLCTRDVFVRGGDSKKTMQQSNFLLLRCYFVELPCHQIVFRSSKQHILGFCDLNHDDGLFFG